MSKYYVVDTTVKSGGKNPVVISESTAGVVKQLEGMCQRQFGMTRKQYMDNSESLGFGPDERTGQCFYEQMEQYFNVGVIRSNSVPMKCNIFEAAQFEAGKAVHGD